MSSLALLAHAGARQVVLKAMYSTEASLGRLDAVHLPAPSALALHSRRVMIGKARVCTSFIEVPQEVSLGDCTIGPTPALR